MLRIYHCIMEQHDAWLVVLALAICVFTSISAFNLAARARDVDSSVRLRWLVVAAAITGGGIWSTHFVAMLAYRPGVPFGYDLSLTITSMAVAVLLSAAGFLIAYERGWAIAGGAVIGLGIGGMHFLGMSAIQVPGIVQWDGEYMAAAWLVGVVFGALALRVANSGARIRQRIGGSALLALAIAGLHFVGMAAYRIVPEPLAMMIDVIESPDALAIAVTTIALSVIALGLAASMVDRRLAERNRTEADRLKAYIVELESTKSELEARGLQLRAALDVADAANSAKSQFLATMSHELRTPLNAIIGFAQILEAKKFGPLGNARYDGYAKIIVDSGNHLLALINDILDLSKLDAGHLELHDEPIDVADVVQRAIQLMSGQAAAAKVRQRADVPHGLPHLRVDARRLRQVLLNLLSNAIKFNKEGGSVKITATCSGSMAISIEDTGIGMADDDIPKAMERFGQVNSGHSRSFDGTGLGLPLAKRLVELHGGTLAISSRLGIGTTVTITLPAERLVHDRAAA